MSHESRDASSFLPFETSLDSENTPDFEAVSDDPQAVMVQLLQQVVVNQQRQTELLEELNRHLTAAQRQKANELNQWKQANPQLARDCRIAAEALSNVQTEFGKVRLEAVSHSAVSVCQRYRAILLLQAAGTAMADASAAEMRGRYAVAYVYVYACLCLCQCVVM